MSKAIFLGVKTPLQQSFFPAQEIYSDLRYPDSLYATEGVFFGEPSAIAKRRVEAVPHLTWYEVMGMVGPFACKSGVREVLPDFYEAALQVSEWFIRFLKDRAAEGEVCLLQLRLGDPADKKIRTDRLPLSKLKPVDFELPFDAALWLT